MRAIKRVLLLLRLGYSEDGTGVEWSVDYSLYYVYGNRSDAGKAGDKVQELGGKAVYEYDELFWQEQRGQEQLIACHYHHIGNAVFCTEHFNL